MLLVVVYHQTHACQLQPYRSELYGNDGGSVLRTSPRAVENRVVSGLRRLRGRPPVGLSVGFVGGCRETDTTRHATPIFRWPWWGGVDPLAARRRPPCHPDVAAMHRHLARPTPPNRRHGAVSSCCCCIDNVPADTGIGPCARVPVEKNLHRTEWRGEEGIWWTGKRWHQGHEKWE